MNQKTSTLLGVLIGCLFTFVNSALSQGSAFTYQGRLNAGGVPANGDYDLSFALYATNANGVAIAGPVTNSATVVSNGLFTTTIDFGAGTFVGHSNWLEIAVSTNGANNFSTLAPRQQLTPAPYAVFANTASNLSGIVLNSSLPAAPTFSGTVTAPGYQTGGSGSFLAGAGNTVSGSYNAIGGGNQNTNTSTYATIGGGYNNRTTAGGQYITIGGGRFNIATANDATIAGGVGNSNSAAAATIGGGYNNIAKQNNSTIGGGQFNTVSGQNATVGGGQYNTAGPGDSATVPGGNANLASGTNSFAAGANAAATNNGSFVWSDGEGTTFSSTNTNSFNVRANGGVVFATAGAGVQVDGVPVLTASPGVIQSYEIDDGGSSAYHSFQQTADALGGDSTVSFSSMSPMTAGAATFSLTINGATFGSVMGFSGCEEISRGYSYVVEVTNSSAIANPDGELGSTASLTFSRNGRSTTFGGIVTACALASGNTSGFLYTVRIVSPLNYYLDRNTDYHVYQQKSIPDILTSILQSDAANSPMAANLTGTYSTRSSLTQFGETELNFVNRFLENDGIFYFFNHSTSPPSLIVSDNTSAYLASPNSPFNYYGNTATNIPSGTEFIRSFQKASHQSTAQSIVNAAPFPTVGTSVQEASPVTAGIGQYYEFGNPVATAPYDTQLAAYRQDIQTAAHAAISGTGTAPDLRAGYTFALADQSGAGLGGSYVVTSVHHAGFIRVTNGVSTLFYGNTFQVVPAALAYRPPLTTPKPHAEPCTAQVTGAAGEEIFTDKYGRIQVQYNWDRHSSGSSTAFVPVANLWAGASHGAIFLPRIGDEVLVSFIQGDPDQPVITGSLYNSADLPPFALPANKTQSGFVTSSSQGGNGFNEFMFDDKAGAEQFVIHAQKDFSLTVLNNWTANIGGGLSLSAGTQISLNSPVSVTGNVTATGTFNGNGSGLTSLTAANLTGALPAISGANLTALNASQLTSGAVPLARLPATSFWQTGGNSGTTAGLNYLGTSDSQPLELHVNTQRALRLEFVSGTGSPNVIGGSPDNFVDAGTFGDVIAGGGATNSFGASYTNHIASQANMSVIAGGGQNLIQANDPFSVIGGGSYNTIQTSCYNSIIAGGVNNTNTGPFATIPGGEYNIAGTNSFAAGFNARATNSGAFVWSDGTGTLTTSTNNNSVTMRASGGFRLFSGTGNATYAYLAPGSGSWTTLSDRAVKEHFETVNSLEVLDRVAALPMNTWNYKTQPADIRHIGPTAQDFKAAFAVGETDTGISVVDEGGVALAAIQGLNQKLNEKDAEIQDLKTRLEKLERLLNSKLDQNR